MFLHSMHRGSFPYKLCWLSLNSFVDIHLRLNNKLVDLLLSSFLEFLYSMCFTFMCVNRVSCNSLKNVFHTLFLIKLVYLFKSISLIYFSSISIPIFWKSDFWANNAISKSVRIYNTLNLRITHVPHNLFYDILCYSWQFGRWVIVKAAEEDDDLINELMNNDCVCRSALALPGLIIILC